MSPNTDAHASKDRAASCVSCAALIISNHRSLRARCTTDAERRWSQALHDTLTSFVVEGDRVLPVTPDPPRIRNRARKRKIDHKERTQ